MSHQDLDFFQDGSLPKTENGVFKQPLVKKSLDKARKKNDSVEEDLISFEELDLKVTPLVKKSLDTVWKKSDDVEEDLMSFEELDLNATW